MRKKFSAAALSAAVTILVSGTVGATEPVSSLSMRDVAIGAVAVNGSGCAAGTAQLGLSTDKSLLTVRPDSFAVEAGGREGRRLDRRNCAVAITIDDVPAGHRVVLARTQLRGNYHLRAGATGRVSIESFVAGATGPQLERVLGSARASDLGRLRLSQSPRVGLECGQGGILRVNAALLASEADASSSEDSRIAAERLTLQLRAEPCAP